MAKKIRIGNDIDVVWTVNLKNQDGTLVDLTSLDIAVQLIVGTKVFDITVENAGLTINGNVISFTFFGSRHNYTGSYVLKLFDANNSSFTYDTRNAFILVDHSWQSIDIISQPTSVEVSSDVEVSRVIIAKGQKGEKGDKGDKGDPGSIYSKLVIGDNGNWFIDGIDTGFYAVGEKGDAGDFTSIVFKRASTAPATPSGGTYEHPVPTGWHDGIPDGTDLLWASTSIFHGNNTHSEWTPPKLMSDSEYYDVEFAVMQVLDAIPDLPNENNRHKDEYPYGYDGQIWFDPVLDAESEQGAARDFTKMFWRAERKNINGTWTDWTILRMQGEKGQNGANGANGTNGENGENVAIVYLYQRSASIPSGPNASSIYSFESHSLISDIGNWKRRIPEGDDPLYVVAATAYCTPPAVTDTIAANEWSSPVKLAENGAKGAGGADGLNSATIFLFRRSDSQPAQPNAAMTYNFATGVITCGGINYAPSSTAAFAGGWSRVIPSGSNQCWVVQATAISTSETDSISTSEWSTASQYTKNGDAGAPGANGKSIRVSVFDVNVPYYAGDTPVDGIYYLDIVCDTDMAIGTDSVNYYMCTQTHLSTSSDDFSPTSTQWSKMTSVGPLVTPLILTEAIKANFIDVNSLVAKRIQTGNSDIGTTIEEGIFNIKKNGVLRARFGVDEAGNIVLQFLNETGTVVLYEFGPNGMVSHISNTAPRYSEVKLAELAADVTTTTYCPDDSDGTEWRYPVEADFRSYYMFQDGVLNEAGNVTYYVNSPTERLTSHSQYHGKLFVASGGDPSSKAHITDGMYIMNAGITTSPVVINSPNKKMVYDTTSGPVHTSPAHGWYFWRTSIRTYENGYFRIDGNPFIFRRNAPGSEATLGANEPYGLQVLTRVRDESNIDNEAQNYRH